MGFQIGAMLDSFRCSPYDAVEQCAHAGVSGIQFYAVSGELDAETVSPSTIKALSKQLRDNHMVVSAVCGDMGGHGFAREGENKYRLEKSLRIARMAESMDCHVVTTHIGVIPLKKNKIYCNMQRVCSKIGQEAAEIGVKFAAETGPEPSETMRDFLKSLDTDSFCVNFDPANIVMVTGEDVVDAVYHLKDYIIHTHAKDGVMLKKTDPRLIYDYFAEGGIEDVRIEQYFKEMPLGQGAVPFDDYFNALSAIGYDGFLTIERETGENPIKDIRLAAEFLRGKIKKYETV